MGTVIRASDFKATCLALLDDVAASRQEYVITKRGRPVARLVPIEAPMPINGSVRLLVDDDDLLFSVEESWSSDAE